MLVYISLSSNLRSVTSRKFSNSSFYLCTKTLAAIPLRPKKLKMDDDLNSKTMEVNSVPVSSNINKNFVLDSIPFTSVTEGKAEVLFPSSHDVFYNPVQEFNRDLSIGVIKQFLKSIPTMEKGVYLRLRKKDKMSITVLEALAASGLRSIRYAKEIEGITKIIANDVSSQAYENMKTNVKHNKVENLVIPENEDASLLMYKNKRKFDIIDIDPYGSAAPFLDSAVQSVTDGGLLMITCTDMAILCGNGIEACHAKYGSVSYKTGSCHEMALRIVLRSIESHANRYGRFIEPILCLSIDFYVRVFVQVFTGPVKVKESVTKLSMVYFCSGCTSYYLQPLGRLSTTEKGKKYCPQNGPIVNQQCDICNSNFKVCGPIWSDKIHNKDFVSSMMELIEKSPNDFNTSKRMLGMLSVVNEELENCPLYHKMDKLFSLLHVISPSVKKFRSALLNAGYEVSMSHAMPTSIKTDAPQHVIWDIVKTWAKLNPGKKTYEEELSKYILRREPSIQVSFEVRPDSNPKSRSDNLLRFQVNPENWGPKSRAKTSLYANFEKEKQMKFQGKRKKSDMCQKSEDLLNTKEKKLKEEVQDDN